MSDAARKGQRRGTLSQQESRTGLAMISPTLVIVVLVVIVPVLWTVLLSFQRIRLLTLRSAGLFGSYTLSNYIDILTSSGFRQSLITTLVYTVLVRSAPSVSAWSRRSWCAGRSGGGRSSGSRCFCPTSRRWSR